jgi:hypothetical protein
MINNLPRINEGIRWHWDYYVISFNAATFVDTITYYAGGTFNSTTNCATYNTATNYDCDCVTNQSVSLIKSVSGTITNVANYAFNAAVASFKTILSGDVVTVQGFSSAGYTSQIGANRTTNISGQATKTKKHGIIAAPVTHAAAQTTVISEFKVE